MEISVYVVSGFRSMGIVDDKQDSQDSNPFPDLPKVSSKSICDDRTGTWHWFGVPARPSVCRIGTAAKFLGSI